MRHADALNEGDAELLEDSEYELHAETELECDKEICAVNEYDGDGVLERETVSLVVKQAEDDVQDDAADVADVVELPVDVDVAETESESEMEEQAVIE